jgi:dTDP-4-amino-4,6-dideoxygalactose transaminase
MPYLTGRELEFVEQALASGHLSGNGPFTKKCHQFFQERYGFRKVFLTASCTDALEMCAVLCDLAPGDEVIIPSYTFVSTANAFALRGARIRFADSLPDNPNVAPESIRSLITDKTKVIVVVHYAGIACDMDQILDIAREHNLLVVEDAAQAIDSYHRGRPLGSLGDFAAFSFHETKNIQCGQGGLAVINNQALSERAEYVWEKGTNRSQFVRGLVDKYSWVDLGSSYLPGESVAALLWAQLLELEPIQKRRCRVWDLYLDGLKGLGGQVALPTVPEWATRNGHLFHLVLRSKDEADSFLAFLRERGVTAVTHYLSLHSSPYFTTRHDGRSLPNSDKYTDGLIRLPLFPDLTVDEIQLVIDTVLAFVKQTDVE